MKRSLRVQVVDKPGELNSSGIILPCQGGFGETDTSVADDPELRSILEALECEGNCGHVFGFRNTAFIQTDNSAFYRRHHHGTPGYSRVIWRDYYYQAYFLAFQYLFGRGLTKVVIDHPISSCNWPEGLFECGVQAAKNQAFLFGLSSVTVGPHHGQEKLDLNTIPERVDLSRNDHRGFPFRVDQLQNGVLYSFLAPSFPEDLSLLIPDLRIFCIQTY